MVEFATLALDVQAPELERIAELAQKVEGAAAFIKAAHPSEERIFHHHHHGKAERKSAGGTWYRFLVSSCTARAKDIIAVVEEHPARGSAVTAERAAFNLLSELTPASNHLKLLLVHDRKRACRELVHQMVLVCSQFERTAALLDGPVESVSGLVDSRPDFETASAKLLREAGGSYNLSGAAKQLEISRQALHKRIHKGTVLGMMVDNEIQVPKLQFRTTKSKKKATILAGVDKVVKPFLESRAGSWAALQFLTTVDPNLSRTPLAALQDGKIEAAEQAARAHLGLDEG